MVLQTFIIANETDQTLAMSIKYSSQAPYTAMNGFPILRVPTSMRESLSKIMADNKPESMLLVLYIISHRLGMIVTNCSYIVLMRENDILISPSDMNAILITILARPYLRCMDVSTPLCLPGIAGDGYLYFTMKFLSPNVGIVFATLASDTFYECLAKANDIAQELQWQNLIPELNKLIEQNYISTTPIVPTGINWK